MHTQMRTDVIVVAAGRGHRAGEGLPKQYRTLGGQMVLRRTLQRFLGQPGIRFVQPVISPDHAGLCAEALAGLAGVLAPVAGGASRQASVRAGLEALAGDPPDLVLIHDAARPFVSERFLADAIAAAAAHGAAVPALALVDTIKAVTAPGFVGTGPDRNLVRGVQTPQSFRYDLILAAHRAQAEGGELTDDAAVAEAAGHRVATFPGDPANIKLTTPEDFVTAERHALAELADVRTATGYDVHAFGPGDHVMLGGVKIPFEQGLAGHSDADVVLHALTDALLGTIGSADIGFHFPPSDPQWKGASSDRFLAHAAGLVRAAGGRIAHLDATVVCEAPKIGPHREAMRARIAEIVDLPLARVSVKATTSERLGFTGRREGIAALAAATVRLPWID
ncbi:bifunctional 2-C-methyl-D-erythritol 4-phosphate cytidylyltransferase/2-C-methyl-D-erythritol 2,4-cyclodiphosphate synthase [Ancylobacter sp. TS-1]|uniref:bifunctional 2-C-methyl-D-erythritol 4-phosphate cytidylyltransferase/2-C-methyl-D-erythritol 2,4-cyclodiphosphate synthase n=1 Tax=Ancylobacter sp. TS-1 TaxID=1850374 RepID=UPI001265AF40|nr:bifunctional 2-C-methyl-D-erythritol 4-phosphate cytidylyltransferase/2-C-methyl-D-erythritol 2,4-cyclodiphosphate synthase [Ancylobacter sp. TS-1]QFR32448.1 bifunctional 2-C-methyl-D-erythritol 4-phosphate cytidylyltransferase/2-C-methyl-D-erythritol 2,4-cyclodiphosphate synthase [Ancylobacter sp. TS-1]